MKKMASILILTIRTFRISTALIILLILTLGNGCKSGQNKNMAYHRQAERYKKNYGAINEKIDTTIFSNNIKRVYKKGVLFRIGKVLDESKYNEFYEFNSDLNLIAVLSCKGDSCSIKMLGNPDW